MTGRLWKGLQKQDELIRRTGGSIKNIEFKKQKLMGSIKNK